MNDINIVTGFWNIRHDRDESRYIDSLKHILSLSHNITIFIPKQYQTIVEEHRKEVSNKTDIIIVELEDIKNKYFKNYLDKVELIRTNPDWYNSCHWLPKTPQSFSEWYNPIVMSKVFFLYDAYKRNKFNSDKYIWIDAGITQHISTEYVNNLSISGMANCMNSVLFPSIGYRGENEMHGFHYSGYKKYTNITPNWLCRATIFGSHKNYIEKFKEEYSYYLSDTLDNGYLGTEESIFSLLTYVNPEVYARYHTENASMPIGFLKKMIEYA